MYNKILILSAFFVWVMLGSFLLSDEQFLVREVMAQVQEVQSSSFTGEVTKIEGETMTVKMGEQMREVRVPSNVSVKRDGENSLLGQVKVNDNVTIYQNNAGEVLRLEVTESTLFQELGTPFLVLGVLAALAVLGMFAWKKNQQAHMKTSVGAA